MPSAEEDMPIESGMLTRSLEGQKKVETYYYDIRKQVFEYDEVMNNQRRAVYPSGGVLDGRALKKQVIGYGERTMSEIVEAYVNPDLPPEEWIWHSWWKGEGVHLLTKTVDQVQGLGMEELKAFLQEQLRNAYDLKDIRSTAARFDAEAERFFIFQQIDTLESASPVDGCAAGVGGSARLRPEGSLDRIQE